MPAAAADPIRPAVRCVVILASTGGPGTPSAVRCALAELRPVTDRHQVGLPGAGLVLGSATARCGSGCSSPDRAPHAPAGHPPLSAVRPQTAETIKRRASGWAGVRPLWHWPVPLAERRRPCGRHRRASCWCPRGTWAPGSGIRPTSGIPSEAMALCARLRGHCRNVTPWFDSARSWPLVRRSLARGCGGAGTGRVSSSRGGLTMPVSAVLSRCAGPHRARVGATDAGGRGRSDRGRGGARSGASAGGGAAAGGIGGVARGEAAASPSSRCRWAGSTSGPWAATATRTGSAPGRAARRASTRASPSSSTGRSVKACGGAVSRASLASRWAAATALLPEAGTAHSRHAHRRGRPRRQPRS
jgi:hypothetical protein